MSEPPNKFPVCTKHILHLGDRQVKQIPQPLPRQNSWPAGVGTVVRTEYNGGTEIETQCPRRLVDPDPRQAFACRLAPTTSEVVSPGIPQRTRTGRHEA